MVVKNSVMTSTTILNIYSQLINILVKDEH